MPQLFLFTLLRNTDNEVQLATTEGLTEVSRRTSSCCFTRLANDRPRGSPLKVFDNVIRNQPEIPLDSKIPSRFTEDSTRFICNVLRNFTNNLNYNS